MIYYFDQEPFETLLNGDKMFFERILSPSKKLYVFLFNRWDPDGEIAYGLWEYWALPNDDPNEFKFEVPFQTPRREDIFRGKDCTFSYGYAEITVEFYLRHYAFFNQEHNGAEAFFIADDGAIEGIYTLFSKVFSTLGVVDGIPESFWKEVVSRYDAIYVRTTDDQEEKHVAILAQESARNNRIIEDAMSLFKSFGSGRA